MSETNYGSTEAIAPPIGQYDVPPPTDPRQALLWEAALKDARAIDQQRAEKGERLIQAREKREAALQEQANIIDQAEETSLPDLEAPPPRIAHIFTQNGTLLSALSSPPQQTNENADTGGPNSLPDLEAPPVTSQQTSRKNDDSDTDGANSLSDLEAPPAQSPPRQTKHNEDQPSSAGNGGGGLRKRIYYLIGGSFLVTVCAFTGLALNGQCVNKSKAAKQTKTKSVETKPVETKPVAKPSSPKKAEEPSKRSPSSKPQDQMTNAVPVESAEALIQPFQIHRMQGHTQVPDDEILKDTPSVPEHEENFGELMGKLQGVEYKESMRTHGKDPFRDALCKLESRQKIVVILSKLKDAIDALSPYEKEGKRNEVIAWLKSEDRIESSTFCGRLVDRIKSWPVWDEIGKTCKNKFKCNKSLEDCKLGDKCVFRHDDANAPIYDYKLSVAENMAKSDKLD